MVTVLSFGFKYGIPADADLVFDVRFLPNPYYEDELRPLTGMDESVFNYVMDNVSDGSIILMHELYQTSLEALEILLPKLYAAGYQVVSVGELASLQGKELQAGHAYRAIMD